MVITFTLQQAYSGSTYEAGPFNISGVTNSGVITELGSNISKSTLLSGYTANDVDDATTGGTINSTGTCTTSRPWTVSGGGATPTPTITPTPTPTITPVTGTQYILFGYGSTTGLACTQDEMGGYVPLGNLQVFANSTTPSGVIKFFNDMSLTTVYDNPSAYGQFLSYALNSDPTNIYSGFYNSSQEISSQTDCIS
jgi:hypothetical protein